MTLPEPETVARQAKTLTSLHEANQALCAPGSLRSKFHRVLTILELHSEVIRSHIVLLRDETSDLYIEASKGLTNEGQEAVFRLGEGITGRVVESAKAIVVPQLDREPLFLNRTGPRPVHSRAELTFISVPILIDGEPVGALSVDLPFREDRDYEESVVFFGLHASMIARAIATDRLAARRERPSIAILALKPDDYDFSNVVGNSGPMQQVYMQVSKVARTNATVMIRGESGTGKELIAHALHYNSKRKSRPFIKVNCAALPDALIESELFGHEKGAFTGAVAQKKGRFELAEGGTLFLDEIGELSASTSTKLLRVLQEREYERLGGTQTIKADVRLIVATESGSRKGASCRNLPRGPLLPAQRFFHFPSSAARAKAGCSAPHRPFFGGVQPGTRQTGKACIHSGDRYVDELSLAGQRPRTEEHHRESDARLRWACDPCASLAANSADSAIIRNRRECCP